MKGQRKRFVLPLELYPSFFECRRKYLSSLISQFWYETQLNWPEILKKIFEYSNDFPEKILEEIIEVYKEDSLEIRKKLKGKNLDYVQDVLDKLLLNYYLDLTLPPPYFFENSEKKNQIQLDFLNFYKWLLRDKFEKEELKEEEKEKKLKKIAEEKAKEFQKFQQKVREKVSEVLYWRFFEKDSSESQNLENVKDEEKIKDLLDEIDLHRRKINGFLEKIEISANPPDRQDEKECEEYKIWENRFFTLQGRRLPFISEIFEKYFREKEVKSGNRGSIRKKKISIDSFENENEKAYLREKIESQVGNSWEQFKDLESQDKFLEMFRKEDRMKAEEIVEKLKNEEEISEEEKEWVKKHINCSWSYKSGDVGIRNERKKISLRGGVIEKSYGFEWVKNEEIIPMREIRLSPENYWKEIRVVIIKGPKESMVEKLRLFPCPEKFIYDYGISLKTFYEWKDKNLIKGELVRIHKEEDNEVIERFMITSVDSKIKKKINWRKWKEEIKRRKNISIGGVEKFLSRVIQKGIRTKDFFETHYFSEEEWERIEKEYEEVRYKRESQKVLKEKGGKEKKVPQKKQKLYKYIYYASHTPMQ